MSDKSKKEGVTVKEIEVYAKGYRYEIFFCALFVLATIFSLIFWGSALSVFFTGIGAIIGALLADKVREFQHKMSDKITSKEGAVQLIIGLFALIIAVFLAPIIFLAVGVNGGKSMMRFARRTRNGHGPKA